MPRSLPVRIKTAYYRTWYNENPRAQKHGDSLEKSWMVSVARAGKSHVGIGPVRADNQGNIRWNGVNKRGRRTDRLGPALEDRFVHSSGQTRIAGSRCRPIRIIPVRCRCRRTDAALN